MTGVVISTAPDTILTRVKNVDPYRTESLSKLISRSYRVSSFLWQSTDTAGTLLKTHDFPKDLTSQVFITQKLADYMLFRSGVKFTVRLVTAGFSYGTLLVGWIPCYDSTSTAAIRHINNVVLSQCNPVVVSASTALSSEQTIPWCWPQQYLKIFDIPSAGFRGAIGSVFIRVLNPLKSASGSLPSPVQVEVYANLDEPEVAGYSPDTGGALRITAEAQSSIKDEAIAKTNAFSGVQEAVNSLTALIGSVTEAGQVGSEMIEKLGPFAAMLALNKPCSVKTPEKTVDDINAHLVYGEGIDLSTKISFSPDALVDVSPALIGALKGGHDMLEILKTPTLLTTDEITSTTLVDTWFEQLPINPVYCSKTPATTRYAGGVYLPTYMAYYSQFYKKWRGGIKYKLMFHTSPNVSATFRIAHFPEIRSFVAPLSSYDGDVVSKVVQVQGDTEVDFFIPYVSSQYALPIDPIDSVSPTGGMGIIGVSLVSPIQTMGSAVTASIYMNTWVAAGEDFRFMDFASDPTDPTIDIFASALAAEIPEAQSDLRVAFQKPFEGLRPCYLNPEAGLVSPENEMNIASLMHRYVAQKTSQGTTNLDVAPGFRTSNTTLAGVLTQSNLHTRLMGPLLFWRGAWRICTVPCASDNQTWAIVRQGRSGITERDAFASGCVRNMKPSDPIMAEIPWRSARLFNEIIPTHLQDLTILNAFGTGGGTVPSFAALRDRLLVSAGDDFVFGVVSACPPIGDSVASTAPKSKGKSKSTLDMLDALGLSTSSKNRLDQYLRSNRTSSSESPVTILPPS